MKTKQAHHKKFRRPRPHTEEPSAEDKEKLIAGLEAERVAYEEIIKHAQREGLHGAIDPQSLFASFNKTKEEAHSFEVVAKQCAHCKRVAGDLLLCTACRSVRYCNKDHQVADWPNHREACRQMSERQTALLPVGKATQRCISRCISRHLQRLKPTVSDEDYAARETIMKRLQDCANESGWLYVDEEKPSSNSGPLFVDLYGPALLPQLMVDQFLPFYIFQGELSDGERRLMHTALSELVAWLDARDMLLVLSAQQRSDLEHSLEETRDLPHMGQLEARLKAWVDAANPRLPSDAEVENGRVVIGMFQIVAVQPECRTLLVQLGFDLRSRRAPMCSLLRNCARVFALDLPVNILAKCQTGWSIIGSIHAIGGSKTTKHASPIKYRPEGKPAKGPAPVVGWVERGWEFLEVSRVSFGDDGDVILPDVSDGEEEGEGEREGKGVRE
eukprot:comp10293_c0_seq1/m.5105 comp10293_c0_seq1/g.5105  ORF comp10293_c0_seq1/g.5105 comp10293_c0_seq1/m.5105 type:complete len:444 (-) comp10293_c0_seq1:390-1721(-)